MKREIVAYVSFGFCCGGPEMGKYGKFEVDLTQDEWDKIDNIIKQSDHEDYICNTLAELYPEIDKKIRDAGQDLLLDLSTEECITHGRDCMELQDTIDNDIKSGRFVFDDSPEHIREAVLSDVHLTELFSSRLADIENTYARILVLGLEWEKWENSIFYSKKGIERFEFLKERDYIDEGTDIEEICGELCYYLAEEELPRGYRG